MPSKLKISGKQDVVAEEIATVLLGKPAMEFKAMFTIIFNNLRARNQAGGEEMLRLRVYEKLQGLVKKGLVDKIVTKGVKEYLGRASLSTFLPATATVVA